MGRGVKTGRSTEQVPVRPQRGASKRKSAGDMSVPTPAISAVGNDVGVDPYKKTLTASVLDCRGGVVATASFRVSGDGHRALEAWVAGLGPVRRWGIEGASSLGRHSAM